MQAIQEEPVESGDPLLQGHILMENRSGLVVGVVVNHADGFAERTSALRLLDCVPGAHAKTIGVDKASDTH
ncbi:hypothetical protein AWV80_40520 [Cupriavidus sp. UYMU48A]|nr:hypothetical protein AWV80_40520 [Cupriavidus sp. UYMU48A]